MARARLSRVRSFTLCAVVLSCLGLFACAGAGSFAPDWRRELTYHPDKEERACLRDFSSFDRAVMRAGVRDAEAARVNGFPYLRVNRFLASYRTEVEDVQKFKAWLFELQKLDAEGRQVEFALLESKGSPSPVSFERLSQCADFLATRDFTTHKAQIELRRAGVVPSHYSFWKRLLGVYPVTNLAPAYGYKKWRMANMGSFDIAPGTWLQKGKWQSYHPVSQNNLLQTEQVADLVTRGVDHPLGLPKLTSEEAQKLLEKFAPVWRVDSAGSFDRPGAVEWQGQSNRAKINTGLEQTYGRIAYTRRGDLVLPQLVYLIWFSQRPKSGRFDLLGGSLDGVIWRVTLGPEGVPLLYDSIHACGCYHMAFPVLPLVRKKMPEDKDMREGLLSPRPAPVLGENERMAVWLSSGSHYLLGLSGSKGLQEGTGYDIIYDHALPDRALRLMPLANGAGSHSLYNDQGLVAQSARLERFTLWLTGIKSPGAMRQWGTHATAFVGERHFDEPFLLERAFE